jgi:hypothetical protein
LGIFQRRQQLGPGVTAHLQFLLGTQFLGNMALLDGSERFFVQSAARQKRDLVHRDRSPADPNIFSGRGRGRFVGDGRSGDTIARADRKEQEGKKGNF